MDNGTPGWRQAINFLSLFLCFYQKLLKINSSTQVFFYPSHNIKLRAVVRAATGKKQKVDNKGDDWYTIIMRCPLFSPLYTLKIMLPMLVYSQQVYAKRNWAKEKKSWRKVNLHCWQQNVKWTFCRAIIKKHDKIPCLGILHSSPSRSCLSPHFHLQQDAYLISLTFFKKQEQRGKITNLWKERKSRVKDVC